MTMQAIQPLWTTAMPLTKEPEPTGEKGASFTDIFKTAIDAVKETDREKTQMQYLLSTGQLDDPAQLSIAEYKATTALDILIKLRSSALEAYNELMRMSL